MRAYKVSIRYSTIIEAESQEEAEQIFNDNLDLGNAEVESCEVENE